MKIAVTGGNGFIGKILVEKLSSLDFSVNILTRSFNRNDFNTRKSIHLFQGDLLNPNTCLEDFVVDCDVIMHCAGEVRDQSKMEALHINGTRNLIEAVLQEANRSNRKIHWVQLSSVGAYGPPSIPHMLRFVDELTPENPVGTYEYTKTVADKILMEAARENPKITYSILRPSIVVSPDMPSHYLRSLIEMVRNKLFFYIGNHETVSTYIHVDDVVEALVLCATDSKACSQTYILSNDCYLRDLIDAVALFYAIPIPSKSIPESIVRLIERVMRVIPNFPLTQNRINSLVCRTRYSSDRIYNDLSWVPEKSIPSSVINMLSLRNNSKD
jgi:nucleoside-diphosphate-sugar epimerase